jgi:peptidoglycan-associated lipoprotein
MTIRHERRLASLAALALLVALSACHGGKRPPALAGATGGTPPASTSTEPETPTQPANAGPDVQPIPGESASGSDLTDTGSLTGTGQGGPLADVLFDLDSAALSDVARAALEKHALWLQAHRELKVTVEGHCDERGTVEFNLALGEQRARAARDYLASLGVAPARLRTVSYGKERPVDPAPNEQAYARNRRAHFAVSR